MAAGILPTVLLRRGLNAGNSALILYSAFLFAVVFIKGRRGQSKIMSVVYWARLCISCLLAVCFLTASVISAFMIKYAYFNEPPAPPASGTDASGSSGTVVVLGCHVYGDRPSRLLKGRLDAAVRFMDSHEDTVAVVSGGRGADETVAEAYVMKQYMLENGIDESRVIVEDRSVSTDENIRFSADIIHENGLPDTFYIVTDAFHSYRSYLFAKKNGYEAYNVSADVYWPLIGEYWVRDILGVLHMTLTPDWDLSPRR